MIAGVGRGQGALDARGCWEKRPLLSGLWASQADDYPVTVQTGHSISELIFSPRRSCIRASSGRMRW